MLSRDGKALGRRVAADDVGVRKDFAQVPHAAADATTEIEHRVDASDKIPRELDLVAGEIVAVAVKEIRLRREDRLVLPGILIEIDARHEGPPATTDTEQK